MPKVQYVKFIGLYFFTFPLLGMLYAYIIKIINWSNAVIIIPWIAAVFGFYIGIIVKYYIRINHLKLNDNLQFVLIFIGLIVTYYFHWVFWVENTITTLFATVQPESLSPIDIVIYLIAHPSELFKQILEINSTGTWALDDDEDLRIGNSKGIVLLIFWVCELFLMLIFSLYYHPKKEK